MMDSKRLFDVGHGHKAIGVFVICLVIMAGAVVLASLIQTDFGRVAVSNVTLEGVVLHSHTNDLTDIRLAAGFHF